MQIAKDIVVAIDYKLTSDQGELIDSSEGGEPLAYIQGQGQLISGLERALEGRQAGEAFAITIAPEDGYGLRDEAELHQVPLHMFDQPEQLQIGLRVQASNDQGTQVLTVVALDGQTVTLDGNHPLAGMNLNFEINVRQVRAATAEELSHGHVHGPEGHAH